MSPVWNRCPICGELLNEVTLKSFKLIQEGNKAFWACPREHKEEIGNKGELSYRRPFIEGTLLAP